MGRSWAAALAVFVLGWIWIAVLGAGPIGPDEIELCPPLGETESFELRTNWWPPAQTRCEVERSSGGGAAVAAARARQRRRRGRFRARRLAAYFVGLP